MADAVAPVSLTASLTFAKTGFPRCVSPAFLGFVPPTTLVPSTYQWDVDVWVRWKSDRTIVDSLLRMESVPVKRAKPCSL